MRTEPLHIHVCTYASKAKETDSRIMINIATRSNGRMEERNERPSSRDVFRVTDASIAPFCLKSYNLLRRRERNT